MAILKRAGRVSARALAIATVTAAVVLVGGQVAFADSQVNVNSSGQGVTATDAEHNCDANYGGGPYVGYDVWVFNLPGDHDTVGDFVSVTAHFDTTGDHQADTTKTIDTDQPSGIVLNGTSKAWIKLPAGWELESASAVITGTADFFTLTHACPAEKPSPSSSPSSSPSGSPSASPSGSPSGSPSPSSSVSNSTTPSPSGSSSQPTLPTTGAPLTAVLIAGLALVAGGGAMVFAARRRRAQV